MNRPDISRLNKNRPIYFKLGLLIALSLTLYAFNWTTYETQHYEAKVIEWEEADILVVPRTPEQARQLPPPITELVTEAIETPELIEELEPEPVPQPKATLAAKVKAPEIKAAPITKKLKPPVKLPPLKVKKEADDNSFIHVAEVMPRFAGCEEENITDQEKNTCAEKKLLDFIYANIKYTPIARENGLQGTVVVSFIVEKDGSIKNIEIMKDVGGGLGAEAVRVAKKMPKWIPGRQRGRKVRVQYRLPIRFKLK